MSERTFIPFIVGLLLSATVSWSADAPCPLELVPPRVAVRHGSPVQVLCRAVAAVEGLSWEADEGSELFHNSSSVVWAVGSLTAWALEPPRCHANVPGHGTCSKTLPLVLYKVPDSISLHRGDAADEAMKENEPYVFICEVQEVAPARLLTVTWYKGNETEVRRFTEPSPQPVTARFVLHLTAHRRDNGARLSCEARLDLRPEGPQHTVTSPEHLLTVHFGPDIDCSRIEIYEWETLEGQCSVTGNPAPSVRWLRAGRAVDPRHALSRTGAGQYVIQADGHVNTQKTVSVSVLYEPELDCLDSLAVAEYSALDPPCTAAGTPPPVLTWSREGEEVVLPDILTRHDAGHYTITAANELANVSRSVEIIVTYPPSEILELEDTEAELGSLVGLKCSSTGVPRPGYSWTYHQTGNAQVVTEDGVSLLLLHSLTGDNSGSYTCQAWNGRGNTSRTVTLTVKGAKAECPIQIIPERLVVPHGGPGSASCKATSVSSPREMFWETPPHGVLNGSRWSAEGHQNWDPRPVCVAVFPGIGRCQKPLHVTLYQTPERVVLRPVNHTGAVVEGLAYPLVEGSAYQLRCDVFGAAPVQSLVVRWYKGNESVKTDSYSADTTRTPLDVSSTLSITPERADEGAQFRCEAQLDLGPDGPDEPLPTVVSSLLNVTVHYEPIINTTRLEKRVPVFRGYPQDLVCEADGHPAPSVQWTYESDKLVRESGGNLTVFESGFYTCHATNHLASSSVVVEVILTEDYLPLIAGFVAVTVVVISVIFVFIYSIYYKNTKMRHYSLKNPKLSNLHGNVAHNGWETPLPMTRLS